MPKSRQDLNSPLSKDNSMNTLYFGDNLEIMRRHIPDESVDLIYLDPPFNSNRDYNVLFREQSGVDLPSQIKAFGDTWNWAGACAAWADFTKLCPVPKTIELIQGFHNAIGENDVMAYLVMMAPRLYHLHRVLKPTGSLYLHCDPTASAYLRLILDSIFGARNFKNEIIWKRTSAHASAKRWGPVHDSILFFAKNSNNSHTWNTIYDSHCEDYLERFHRFTDDVGKYRLSDLTGAGTRTGDSGKSWREVNPTTVGRHWAVPSKPLMEYITDEEASEMSTQQKLDVLDEHGFISWPVKSGVPQFKRYLKDNLGVPLQDVISDVKPIGAHAKERLGYPTKKPLALLERIVAASSNPGDVILDPFCGCGTTVVAAQKMGRDWLGIDITPIATSLVQKRLFDTFGAKDTRLLSKDDPAQRIAFATEGLPTDLVGAKLLYEKDVSHKDFEMWAVGLVPAIPQEKKGADRGIDGIAYFHDNPKKPSKAIIQVKGGGVSANQIRDLFGAMHTAKAQLAFFITLEPPMKAMKEAALAAGYYQPPSRVGRRVEALQIRTIEELLKGKTFDFPLYGSNVSYQQAERVKEEGNQGELGMWE